MRVQLFNSPRSKVIASRYQNLEITLGLQIVSHFSEGGGLADTVYTDEDYGVDLTLLLGT